MENNGKKQKYNQRYFNVQNTLKKGRSVQQVNFPSTSVWVFKL